MVRVFYAAEQKSRCAGTSSRRTGVFNFQPPTPNSQLPGSGKLEAGAGSGLEQVPNRELDVPAVARLRDDAAEVRVGDVRVRSAQVRMVDEVEHLHPQLHLVGAREGDVLE